MLTCSSGSLFTVWLICLELPRWILSVAGNPILVYYLNWINRVGDYAMRRISRVNERRNIYGDWKKIQ